MKIYIYKLIKEFLFLEYLRSTLKDKILLNILFNNLSNINNLSNFFYYNNVYIF